MKAIVVVAIAVMLGGCSWAKDHVEINSYYSGRATAGDVSANLSAEMRNFIQDVSRNRSTIETNVDGVLVRGVFSGENGACGNVSVMRLEGNLKAPLRPVDYVVCGPRIARIGEGEVTPTFPDTADARTALANAKRNAVLYGTQTVRFYEYVINSRRLGIDTSRPCRPVETVISYHGRIVYHDNNEICI